MKFFTLLMCLIFAQVSTGSYAQAPDITGIIKNQNSEPISNAYVQLLNSRYETYTDETGNFSFSQVSPGEYILNIQKAGFAEMNRQISVSNIPLDLVISLQPESQRLSEVTVTAQKREEQIQRIPLSITSLSYKVIEENQIWTTNNLSAISPNLYASDPGDRRAVTSLRGIISTSYDPAVTTYIDGVNQFNLDTYIAQLFDVKRIEVLRGPQGTLYGRNAMGGVINIITKEPEASTSVFGEATVGNYNRQRYVAGVRTSLVDDKLYFGIAGLYESRNGFYKNAFNNTSYDKQYSYSGNYYLKYYAGQAWDLTLNLKHIANRNDGAFPLTMGVEEAFEQPYVLNQNQISEMVDNTLNTSLSINYSGNNFNFSSQSAYQQNYRYYKDPIDGDFSPYDAISIFNNYGEDWNNVKVLTQEFRFSSPGAKEKILTWTAGSYLFYQESPVKQATVFGEDAALMGSEETNYSLITTSEGINKGLAFFGQASVAVSEKLNLVVGLRYDLEDKEQSVLGEYQPNNASEPVFEFQQDTTAQTNFSGWSPKAGFTYEFSDENLAFINYSHGFRAGGLTSLSSDPSQPPLYRYAPEFSNNFEFGTKNSFFENRLFLNVVLFYSEVTDVQVPTLILPDAITITRNTGKLSSKGAELEIRALPFKDLELSYDFGFTDAEYNSLELAQEGEIKNFQGNKQIFTPEVTSRLALLYGKSFGSQQNKRVSLRAEWKYFGQQFFDLANTLEQGPYHLFNAHIGFSYQDWKITFWGRNLFDKQYISYGYDFGAVHLGNPQTYGTTLSFKI